MKRSLKELGTLSLSELERFRRLLDLPGEGLCQEFLSQYPRLLTKVFDGEIVVPKYRLGTEFETDFLLISSGSLGNRVTLVELEPPTSPPFTKSGRYARRLNEAWSQVHEWMAWIDRNHSYFADQLVDLLRHESGGDVRAKFLLYRSARCSVDAKIVIGRRDHLTAEHDRKRRSIYMTSQRMVEITNYDRLLDAAVKICSEYVAKGANPQQLGRVAKTGFAEIRRAVAASTRVSVRTLNHLAVDASDEVRCSVASNSRTPSRTLGCLAVDVVAEVRREVARNFSTSPRTLERLFNDDVMSIPEDVLRNPRCPTRILQEAIADERPAIRRIAAGKNDLQVEAQSILAEDEDDDVRRILARNRSLCSRMACRMVEDPDRLVRVGLYRKQDLPEALLIKRLWKEMSWVRAIIAQHANLRDPEILAKLSRDRASKVREGVARNPNLPERLRVELLQDTDERVRLAAARQTA